MTDINDVVDDSLEEAQNYVQSLVKRYCCYPNNLESGLSKLEDLTFYDSSIAPLAKELLMNWLDNHRNYSGLDRPRLQNILNSREMSYLLDFAIYITDANITTVYKLISENINFNLWRYSSASGLIADRFPRLDKDTLNSISEQYYDLSALIDFTDISSLSPLEQDDGIKNENDETDSVYIETHIHAIGSTPKSPLLQRRSGLLPVHNETRRLIVNKNTDPTIRSIIYTVKKASDFELNFASVSVSGLVKAHLNNNKPTPLYFRREKIYKDIIERKVNQFITSSEMSDFQTLLEINAAKNELSKLKLENENKINNNPYILAYAWEAFNDIASTELDLFNGIDCNKLFFSDLIYSYRDFDGQTKEDVISIVDYLCSKANNHPITSRKSVSLSWPKEIAPQKTYSLTSFLQEEAGNLLVQLEKARFLKEIEQMRAAFNKYIKKPTDYFQTILDKLLLKYPSHPKVTLADTVQYNNQVSTININYQGTANYANPPVSLTFSVADILSGRVREWESTHISYNRPKFSRLGKISTELLSDLQNEDIQPQYVDLLRTLGDNKEVKSNFYCYLRSILQFHDANKTGSYTIEQAPLLLVCPNPNAGPSLPIPSSRELSQDDDPIQVVSLQTNDAITFPSINDFRQQIRKDGELRKWVALHFPAGFSGDYGDLKIGRYKTDYSDFFERMINQYADDMDVWVRSASEAGALKAFAIIEMLSPVLALPSFVMTPVAGFIYGAAVAATPHLGRAAISDTDEERDEHLKSAAYAVTNEAVFHSGLNMAALTITKAAGRLSRFSSRVTSNMPDAKARGFKVQGHKFKGRVKNGRFEVSSNNGRTWNKGGKAAEFAWRMQNAGPGPKKFPQPEAAGAPPVVPLRPAGTLNTPPVVPPRPEWTLNTPPVAPPRPTTAGNNILRVLEESPAGSASEIVLFTNKSPGTFQAEVMWARARAKGPFRRGDSGFNELVDSNEDFKWVLTPDRNIAIGRELSHAVLGNSESVIAAGHAKKISDGKIWISNQTGHYQADYQSIQQSISHWKEIGYVPHVDEFSKIVNNKYIDFILEDG